LKTFEALIRYTRSIVSWQALLALEAIGEIDTYSELGEACEPDTTRYAIYARVIEQQQAPYKKPNSLCL